MEIKQIKAYRLVSVLSLALGLVALQEFYISESFQIIGFVTGVLGGFLIGSASIVTTIRFLGEFLKGSEINLSVRIVGGVLSLLPTFLWLFGGINFVLVPAFNAEQLSDFFLPSAMAVANGMAGIFLFFAIVTVNNRLLSTTKS